MKTCWRSALALGLLMLLGSPAIAQLPGQPYQIPAGYEGAPAGASISYGGAYYVIQDNGTMLLQQDQGGQTDQTVQVDQTAYQIPAGYGGYAAGTTISYGGANYVIQGNGTMVPAVGYAGGGGGYPAADQTAYQIPPGYGGYADGSTLSYGGVDYMVQNNVMFRINPGNGGRFGYSSGYKGVVGGTMGAGSRNGQPASWPQNNQGRGNQGGGQMRPWGNQGNGQPMNWVNNQGGGQPMRRGNQAGGQPMNWANNQGGGQPMRRDNQTSGSRPLGGGNGPRLGSGSSGGGIHLGGGGIHLGGFR